jgi:hypothetical protein
MTDTASVVSIGRRAAMALSSFPREEQVRVRSTIGQLLGPTAIEELGRRVRRLPSDELLYSIRVPPDILVIFARQGSNTTTVVDVFRRGALEAYAASMASAKTAGNPGPE